MSINFENGTGLDDLVFQNRNGLDTHLIRFGCGNMLLSLKRTEESTRVSGSARLFISRHTYYSECSGFHNSGK